MAFLRVIEWVNDAARIIDQTKLPADLIYREILTAEEMFEAIKTLTVRGAPAIGIAAAFGVYCGARDFPEDASRDDFLKHIDAIADFLASSRPTAVNLFWALERMKKKARTLPNASIKIIKQALLDEAKTMLDEDISACKKIGEYGFDLLKNTSSVLTHCNAGSLATGGCGTALAPLYIGKEKGKLFHVYVDETRPLLQGARITAFELIAAGIPVTLICDNMSAAVMAKGKVDAVIVGADRIAANGDTANKIGTYGLALIAKAHKVPFYVAAPVSTFDVSILSGDQIPIEQRSKSEIINGFGKPIAPMNVEVFNPAFDVTPHKLITAFITERGVLRPPFRKGINSLA